MRQLNKKPLRPKIYIALIFIAVGVLFFIKTKQERKRVDVTESPETSQHSLPAAALIPHQANAVSSQDSVATAKKLTEVPTMNNTEFRSWIHGEAQSLNSTDVNTEEKEIQMKAVSQSLSPSEIAQLAEIVSDSNNAANDKILSSYLLTLRQNDDVIPLMVESAKKSLTDFGIPNAHSEAEFKHGQELALKMTFVDELAARSNTSATALNQLRSLASAADSNEIRVYAQRKLKEMGK